MAEKDYYQKYLSDIVGGMTPQLRTQKKSMYDFLLSNALRTGQSATAVAEGMRPFAEAAGAEAAGSAKQASAMAQRQEQFETQQSAWEKQFAESQKMNEAARQQADFSQMMQQYQQTGVMTPQMMERMGLTGISAGDVRSRDRQMELLGMQPGGQPGEQAPWAGGGFGQQNKMLYQRAMMPGSQFSTKSQRRQQQWLQSQFG